MTFRPTICIILLLFNQITVELGGLKESAVFSRWIRAGVLHWIHIMQFLRIAGDDVEKTHKKRTPKVQKHFILFVFFCVAFL